MPKCKHCSWPETMSIHDETCILTVNRRGGTCAFLPAEHHEFVPIVETFAETSDEWFYDILIKVAQGRR